MKNHCPLIVRYGSGGGSGERVQLMVSAKVSDVMQDSDAARENGVDRERAPKVAARVTVNLSRKTVDALNATSALTDDNRTEVINKAVQLYREVQEAQHSGGGIWIQSHEGTEPVLVRFY